MSPKSESGGPCSHFIRLAVLLSFEEAVTEAAYLNNRNPVSDVGVSIQHCVDDLFVI
jgi:hypothetical protein